MTDTSRIADLRFQVSEKMPINHSDLSGLFDHIEALEGKVERLRFHLDTALEALIMEGVCDGECGACKEARAELINPNKGDQ